MLPQKTTKNILRDCLKLVPNMVKEEQKVLAVRKLVIQEFRKNKDLTDADQIEKLRDNAIRGISNYMIFMIKEQYLKDPKKEEYFDQQKVKEEEDEATQQTFN